MLGRGLMTMGVLLAITGCVVSADAKRVMERYAQSRVGVEPIRAFGNHESAWCGAKDSRVDCLWVTEPPSELWRRAPRYQWVKCGNDFGERGCLEVTRHMPGDCKLWFSVDSSGVISSWRYAGEPTPCWRLQGIL
jgi:hypothetical protein